MLPSKTKYTKIVLNSRVSTYNWAGFRGPVHISQAWWHHVRWVVRLGVTWMSTLSPSIIVWWRTFSRKDLKCAATEGTEKHHRLPHAGDMALCALLTSEATCSCSLFTVRHHSGQLSMFDLADFYSGCPSWHNPKWNLCLQLEVSQWSLPSKCVNHDAVEAHTFWTSESENKDHSLSTQEETERAF